jgi:hypothetical protein
MSDGRLPTETWIKAHLHRLNIEGIAAVVVRRGEAMGGSLILKLNQRDLGCRVLTQARAPDGTLGWLAAFEGRLVEESEADGYIGRATKRDPDLWVIEIDDRAGRHYFEGKVM